MLKSSKILIFFVVLLLFVITGVNKNAIIKLLVLQSIISILRIRIIYKKFLFKKPVINKKN